MSVISLDEWRKKQDERSTSQSQSTQTSASDETGPKPTDDELGVIFDLYVVLRNSRIKPFTTKSDFARKAATEIGMLASEGMISTKMDETTFTNVWMITPDGIEQMEAFDALLSSRH